jgi:chaperonin GroEL (HSP60 family)
VDDSSLGRVVDVEFLELFSKTSGLLRMEREDSGLDCCVKIRKPSDADSADLSFPALVCLYLTGSSYAMIQEVDLSIRNTFRSVANFLHTPNRRLVVGGGCFEFLVTSWLASEAANFDSKLDREIGVLVSESIKEVVSVLSSNLGQSAVVTLDNFFAFPGNYPALNINGDIIDGYNSSKY